MRSRSFALRCLIGVAAVTIIHCGGDDSGPGPHESDGGDGAHDAGQDADGTGGTSGSDSGGYAGVSGSSGSNTGGSTAAGWGCIDNGSSCDCYDQPTAGYDKSSCGAYSCCLFQTWPNGLQQCFCSNTSPCSGNSSSAQVAQCPP